MAAVTIYSDFGAPQKVSKSSFQRGVKFSRKVKGFGAIDQAASHSSTTYWLCDLEYNS